MSVANPVAPNGDRAQRKLPADSSFMKTRREFIQAAIAASPIAGAATAAALVPQKPKNVFMVQFAELVGKHFARVYDLLDWGTREAPNRPIACKVLRSAEALYAYQPNASCYSSPFSADSREELIAKIAADAKIVCGPNADVGLQECDCVPWKPIGDVIRL